MASVQQLDDNKYKIFVELGYNDFGKRIRRTKTVTVTSERDLKNKVRDFEIECFTNKEDSLDNITFAKFTDRWIANHVDTNLAINTKHMYENALNQSILDYFGKMQMKKIKKIHIVEFFTKEQNEKKKNLKTKLTVLKSIFSKAVEWEVVEKNPTIKVKVNTEGEKEMDFYTEDEVKELFKLLEKVNPKHRMIIKIAVVGGLRRSEIAGITFDAIDFENNSILVDKQLIYRPADKKFFLTQTKQKKDRTVYFSEDFMKELKSYYINQKKLKLEMGNLWRGAIIDGKKVDLLFTKSDGTPSQPDSITHIWRYISDKHNLRRIRFHDLRHTCASLMVKKGVNFKVIQERLGHTDIKMTLNRYSHLSDEQERDAAKVFDDVL